MKSKNNKIYGLVTIVLLALIALFTYDLLFSTSKEIKISRNFMSKLESIYAINSDMRVDKMNFQTLEVKGSIDKNVGHTVICEKYGINLDQNFRVVGFSKKETKHGNTVNITEIEAVDIATKFVAELIDEKVEYKEIKTVEGQNLPYYNVVFTKKKDDYIFFDKEVVLQIDKYTGELDGYSNSYVNDTDKFVTGIKVDEKYAYAKVEAYINETSEKLIDSKYLGVGYATVNNDTHILAHCFDIAFKTKDSTSIERYKIKVNAQTGEILNVIK